MRARSGIFAVAHPNFSVVFAPRSDDGVWHFFLRAFRPVSHSRCTDVNFFPNLGVAQQTANVVLQSSVIQNRRFKLVVHADL